MDYITEPCSRLELRNIACVFRKMFNLSCDEIVPVVELLDLFCDRLGNVSYDIVDDEELPKNVPAATELNCDGTFTIKIKNSVYEGAYYRQIGGYRNHIMHEMCHVVLYKLGYVPAFQRSFENKKIQRAFSAEWQAMALCGEIMMPYEATKNMTADEIADKYKVSLLSAQTRLKY